MTVAAREWHHLLLAARQAQQIIVVRAVHTNMQELELSNLHQEKDECGRSLGYGAGPRITMGDAPDHPTCVSVLQATMDSARPLDIPGSRDL